MDKPRTLFKKLQNKLLKMDLLKKSMLKNSGKPLDLFGNKNNNKLENSNYRFKAYDNSFDTVDTNHLNFSRNSHADKGIFTDV